MSTDAPEELFADEDGVLYAEEVAPQHGILGFTTREVLIVGVWLVMFATSFFPVFPGATSLWAQGIQWILPLGLPTVAVFLVVLRRFSPEGIRTVGSLGIDQFASVAFSVSAVYWLTANWDLAAVSVVTGDFALTWLTIVQFLATLALVVLSVFAPIIPGLRDDFRGRLVTLAHRNANPVRPVIARPRPERPVAPVVTEESASDPDLDPDDVDDITHDADELGLGPSVTVAEHASGGAVGTEAELDDDYVPGYARSSRGETDDEPVEHPEPVEHDEPVEQPFAPFWALAPTERDVLDEQGTAMFRIGPHAWALVIEDRGGAYVIRHDDGRIGFLHDIDDLTRG